MDRVAADGAGCRSADPHIGVNPASVCFYIPPELQKFKADLFHRIGSKIVALGGATTKDHTTLGQLAPDVVPIVGCSIYLRPLIDTWRASGRPWIYWDRGYARRVFATWLPRGDDGGYYRWHCNSFQLPLVRAVPDDRWRALNTPLMPWRKGGKHIVVARPSKSYLAFHGIEKWTDETVYELSLRTDRQLVIRDKESKRDLRADLEGAHALVTHGSIAAVEAVIMGTPVYVDESSAAALVGQVGLRLIEKPFYPERQAWANSLAYSQFNERELVDGTLWRLLT